MLAISLLVVLLWLGRVRLAYALALVVVLFAGLYFSYSQSSMVVLFATVFASTVLLADRRSRNLVIAVAIAFALMGGAFALLSAKDTGLRRATSGRSRLVSLTTTVIRNHPVVGVGIGSQPLASRREVKTRRPADKNASHTTPLTVFAELGVIGFALYLLFLAGATRLLVEATKRRRALGLGLAVVFLALFLHSLFYSGFFEDPIMWGALAVAALVGRRRLEADPPPACLLRFSGSRAAGTLSASPLLAHEKRVLLAVAGGLALVVVGLGVLWLVFVRTTPPSGSIDTALTGVTTVQPRAADVNKPIVARDTTTVLGEFGGNPQRSLARTSINLGVPTKSLWARAMGSYMEYPPSYCEGHLYVNTFGGRTVAVDARTGTFIWSRGGAGAKASTPAVAGPRLIVTSHDGSVTALDRANGRVLWKLKTNAKVESSPLARRRCRLLRSHRRPPVRSRHRNGTRSLGIQHRRTDQLEPVALGKPSLHHDVRGLHLLPRPTERPQALEPLLQARLLPLRQLLCEPVDGRQADLHRLALGQGLRGERDQRPPAMDRKRRIHRVHDAGRERRQGLRRGVRRIPPCLQRRQTGRSSGAGT